MKQYLVLFLSAAVLLAVPACTSPAFVPPPAELTQTVMSQTLLLNAAIPKVQAGEFTWEQVTDLLKADLECWQQLDAYYHPDAYAEGE